MKLNRIKKVMTLGLVLCGVLFGVCSMKERASAEEQKPQSITWEAVKMEKVYKGYTYYVNGNPRAGSQVIYKAEINVKVDEDIYKAKVELGGPNFRKDLVDEGYQTEPETKEYYLLDIKTDTKNLYIPAEFNELPVIASGGTALGGYGVGTYHPGITHESYSGKEIETDTVYYYGSTITSYAFDNSQSWGVAEPNKYMQKNYKKIVAPYCTNISSSLNTEQLEYIEIGTRLNETFSVPSFSDFKNLKTVIYGDTLEDLPNNAFRNCENLRDFKFPQNIKNIGDNAFEGCYLNEVVIPDNDNYISIGDQAFLDATINKIVLPQQVEYIGAGAFKVANTSTCIIEYNYLDSESRTYPYSSGAKVEPYINIEGKDILIGKESYTYTGSEIIPEITLAQKFPNDAGEVEFLRGSQYKVVCENNTNIGTASCYIEGLGDECEGKINFKGKSATKTFEITQADINNCLISFNSDNFIYSGVQLRPEVTVTYNEMVISPDNYKVEYSNNINVGNGTVKITGVNNLKGNTSRFFQINQLDLSQTTMQLSFTSAVYNKGKDIKPTVTVFYNNSMIPTSNYKITYSNNREVGTATVIITGVSNCNGMNSANFLITDATENSNSNNSNSSNNNNNNSNSSNNNKNNSNKNNSNNNSKNNSNLSNSNSSNNSNSSSKSNSVKARKKTVKIAASSLKNNTKFVLQVKYGNSKWKKVKTIKKKTTVTLKANKVIRIRLRAVQGSKKGSWSNVIKYKKYKGKTKITFKFI